MVFVFPCCFWVVLVPLYIVCILLFILIHLRLSKKKTKNKKQKTKAKMFTKVYHNFFLYTAVYAQKLMTLGHCTDLLIMDSQCHGAT